MSEEVILDLKGLKCPLPVLKTRKAMTSLSTGDRVTILTTDPMAAIDIPHYCQESGHRLVSAETQDGMGKFILEKG